MKGNINKSSPINGKIRGNSVVGYVAALEGTINAADLDLEQDKTTKKLYSTYRGVRGGNGVLVDPNISPDEIGLEQDPTTKMVYPTYRGIRSTHGEAIDPNVDPEDLGLIQNADTKMVYPTYRNTASSRGVKLDTDIDADDFWLEQDPEDYKVYVVYNDENTGPQRGSTGIPLAGGGGGGGGGGNNAVLTVTNTTGWLSKSISTGQDCVLSLEWSSLEDGVSTGDGSLVVTVDGVTKVSRSIHQGAIEFNISTYLAVGTNRVKVKISDVYDNTRTITFTISVISIEIKSYFSSATAYEAGKAVPYTYIPVGDMEKTVYFVVDGTTVGTVVTSASGSQLTYNLPAMTHGAHSLLVYFTGEVDGAEVTSNELYYSLIIVDESSTVPIIATPFRQITAEQFEVLQIPYTVYTPNRLNSNITLAANGTEIAALSVDRTEHMWSYRCENEGTLTLALTSGVTTCALTVAVSEASIHVDAVTDDLALYLTSYGRSNNEADPSVWEDTDNEISATLSNFNFASDGWLKDEQNITVLRVGGDARVTIPYKPFATNFSSTGKTFEIEFATRNVLDYDAVVMSCMSDDRGFSFTAQQAILRSPGATVSTQYNENSHIRISFVVEKRAENRLVYVYINGIMSGITQYNTYNDFSQLQPVDISIGSNNCTIDIYNIRIYDNNLTRQQVLNNWIADTENLETLIARYNHNNVFDAYGNITINKLPTDLPYFVLEAPELPQYKGDKKTITGRYVDPVNGANSFEFTGCQIDVQGTSSAPYARKNYDMQFKNGFEMSGGAHADNYALTSTVVPFNRFVLKADVASSESANNVELVKLYCDLNPFVKRERLVDSRVRDGIYGFPIVVFWYNTVNNKMQFMGKYNFNFPKRAPGPYGYSGNMESWEFQNNTSDLMLFQTDYFDETMRTDPDTGDTKEAWRFDYEARFPSDEWVDYSKLQELQSFIYSTYRDEATGENLSSPVTYEGVTYNKDTADYRLAKFRAEFGNYAEVNSFIFYYIFTEIFLMMDSRAKNLFIGFCGSDTSAGHVIDRKAVAEPYDMDTAIGTNNEGQLTYGYNLEDVDILPGGAKVFNGQDSVLWCNIRDAFKTEIVSMYRTLRSGGVFNYAIVEQRFEDHQSKWPEAVFNEDSYFKYIAPLIAPDPGKNPESIYLPMLQGSKAEQRKWWLYNRFRYMDSKWNAGDALSDVIQLRAYAVSDITITPYADIYATVKFGSYTESERATKNVPITIECPSEIGQLNDTEIYVYSSSQLKSLGDLSGFKLGLAEIGNATKLQSLKIGDESSNYDNPNLYTLTFGSNTLLRTIDVRNCSGLGDTTKEGHTQKTVDISQCTNVEHVYFEGTKITGITLPDGGILKTLHLPETIETLVIMNQPLLSAFTVNGDDYSHITTLRIENSGVYIPYKDIIEAMPANSNVRLVNSIFELDTKDDAEDLIEIFDTMRGLDETGAQIPKAVLSGTMTISDTVSAMWLEEIQVKYPDLLIVPDSVISDVIAYLTSTLTWWHDNSVETVRAYAFAAHSTLKDVKTSASLIEPYAFQKATGLTTVDLRNAGLVTINGNAFNGATALRHLIIRSESVSVLSNTNALRITPIYANDGVIYVRDDLQEAYKSASGWSTFAESIRSINEYPITDLSTISDDWEIILTNPNYRTDYKIGDTKRLVINDHYVYMTIAAFDTDVLASDQTKTAKITWIAKHLYSSSHNMNSNNTAVGGWGASGMRTWLRDTLYPTISEDIKNHIVDVIKTYRSYDGSTYSTESISDSIWIPSAKELNVSNGIQEDSGVTYSGIFTQSVMADSNGTRVRFYPNGEGSAENFWTTYYYSRTVYNETQFKSVQAQSGKIRDPNEARNANGANGVLIGFCTN